MKPTMMYPLSFLVLLFLSKRIFVFALIPHSFWNGKLAIKNKFASQTPASYSGYQRTHTCKMYFDDCERRGIEGWDPSPSSSSSSSWAIPFSEEKQRALERHMGFKPDSASKLSEDEVEEETLLWAVDTNVVWDCGEEDCDTQTAPYKYHSISDLTVAPSTSVVDSVVFMWSYLQQFFEEDTKSIGKDNNVHMIVFSKTKALWDYDVMVTMLRSFEICKPLLPPAGQQMKLELFHPDYKHAPKMWSPQTHSPFPTIGVQFISGKEKQYSLQDDGQQDIDFTRDKLKALFDSADAVPRDLERVNHNSVSEEAVMEQCQKWMIQSSKSIASLDETETDWSIEVHTEPYQVYNSLWKAIGKLSSDQTSYMVVIPFLDAHTTQRVAVTVNAALRRFSNDIRIVNVFHPDGKNSFNTPHPMIHFVRKRLD